MSASGAGTGPRYHRRMKRRRRFLLRELARRPPQAWLDLGLDVLVVGLLVLALRLACLALP